MGVKEETINSRHILSILNQNVQGFPQSRGNPVKKKEPRRKTRRKMTVNEWRYTGSKYKDRWWNTVSRVEQK